jgi:hypothetical protein
MLQQTLTGAQVGFRCAGIATPGEFALRAIKSLDGFLDRVGRLVGKRAHIVQDGSESHAHDLQIFVEHLAM